MSQNITYKVQGDKLIIEVDLTQRIGPSSTGKTIMIASSQGNCKVTKEVSFGLNVFTKEGAGQS